MTQPGIFHTRNDGLQWFAPPAGAWPTRRAAWRCILRRGLVAAGTVDGLYVSRDAAVQFERIVGGMQVLAQTFDLDGQHLWFSSHAGQPALMRIALKAGAKPEVVNLPPLRDDAVAYIAQNPARRSEIAIATFSRNVFISRDAGGNWATIAVAGVTQGADLK